MSTTLFYKIRNKANPQLFRMADGRWNKSGKVYDTLGKLRATITHWMNNKNNDYSDWEIIEYEVTLKEVKQLHEVIDPKKIFKLLQK